MRTPLIICLNFLLLSYSLYSYQTSAPPIPRENNSPDLSLYGVMVSKDNSSSIAVIKDEKVGKILILKIGESIKGFQLIQILKDRIVLHKDSQACQVFLKRNLFMNSAPIHHEKPMKQYSDFPRDDLHGFDQAKPMLIRKEFIRSEVEKRIAAEWQLIAKETKFIPNRVNNEINGFKITRLPGGSILSEIGIHKNDIIKAVNGIELNDTITLLSLFDKFWNDSQIEISLERKGTIYNIICILKN
jgi:type II secretion system protein C